MLTTHCKWPSLLLQDIVSGMFPLLSVLVGSRWETASNAIYGCLVEHLHNPPQAERKHFIFLETNSDLLPYSWLGGWGQKYSEERRITLNQKSAEGEKSQSLEWKGGIELETETLGGDKKKSNQFKLHHQGKVDLHSQSNIGSVLESSVLGSMG